MKVDRELQPSRGKIPLFLLEFPGYWNDVHQIFTRYSSIFAAISACIYKAIFYSASERQSKD